MWTPPPPSVLMAPFTSGTASSMPSISSYGRSSPAIGSDGTVYVGSKDKKLYAINGKTGVKLWEFETGNLCGPPPQPSALMARFTSGQGTKSSMPSMARLGSSYGNLKREVSWNPPPPSALMAQFTSGQVGRTKSSMPSMARLGSSYGNLKRDVLWTAPPPSARMARYTSGHGTRSSMPSMARLGSSYGNLKREVCALLPRHRL